MKLLTTICITLLLLSGCQRSSTTNAEKAGLIPGSESPILKKCANGTAYIYTEYEIHVEPSPEQNGMNIFLYKPEVSVGNPCSLDRKNAAHIIGTGETEGNNFFAGIYGSYLFIDQGTGADQRMLSIYDLKEKKLILFTEYSDPDLKNGVLTYFKSIPPDPAVTINITCPNTSKWTEQGLTVLYEQKQTFDLKSETGRTLEKYRCRAGQ